MSNDTRAAKASMDRRSLIAKSAAAAGIAWTAPVVTGSFASPAAAASGCQECHYAWYATGNTAGVLDPQTVASPWAAGMCSGQTDNTPTLVTDPVNDVGLTALSTGFLTHVVPTFSTAPVTLTMDAGSSFRIIRVAAVVHQNGAPTSPDCPLNDATGLPYFEPGTTHTGWDPPFGPPRTGIPVVITAGSIPVDPGGSVTIEPNTDTSFFTALCQSTPLHWGSPTGTGLVVTLQCID